MVDGINLASHPVRSRRLLGSVVGGGLLLGLVATGIHLHAWIRNAEEIGSLREESAGMEKGLESLVEEVTAARLSRERSASREVVAWLAAVERSGVSESTDPVEVLACIEAALPMDSRVLSVKVEPSPPDPRLTVHILAGSPQSAADFVSVLAASDPVVRTEILDEKHGTNGDIVLAIQAVLKRGGDDT